MLDPDLAPVKQGAIVIAGTSNQGAPLRILFEEQLELMVRRLSLRDLVNLSLVCKKLRAAISPVMPCEKFMTGYATWKLARNDKNLLGIFKESDHVHLICGPYFAQRSASIALNPELSPISACNTECKKDIKCITFHGFPSHQLVGEVLEFMVRIGIDRRKIKIENVQTPAKKFSSIIKEIEKFPKCAIRLSIVPYRFIHQRDGFLVYKNNHGELEVCVSVAKAHGELAGRLIAEIAEVRRITHVNFYGICGSLSSTKCPRNVLVTPVGTILPFVGNDGTVVALKNCASIEDALKIECHGHVENVLDENYFAVQRADKRGIVTVEMESFYVVTAVQKLSYSPALQIVFEVTDIVGSATEDLTQIQQNKAVRMERQAKYDDMVRACFWPT